MMKNPEIRSELIVRILLIAAGTAVTAFIDMRTSLVLLCTALLSVGVSLIFHHSRSVRLSALCDEIDEILHGKENFAINSFREGELGILSSEIHKMTIRLREQNSALKNDKLILKETMEDISHQLRTPLTSMILILGRLRQSGISDSQRTECCRELYGLLDRMQRLIETLLGLSRIEAGATVFRKETINCRELVASAIEPVEIALELKGITADIIIEGEPSFCGDRQYCTEALTNILKNCMEHTPENGKITIEVTENAMYSGIKITDSGEGIRPDELPYIFERFRRSSEYTKNGYGIGLAFARKIAASQNGSLTASNSENGGAVFDMRFYKTVV